MKFYKVLFMTLAKYSGDTEFSVGSHGTTKPMSLEECKEYFKREKGYFFDNPIPSEVKVLKDEYMEFQGKRIYDDEVRITSLKIVEINILED